MKKIILSPELLSLRARRLLRRRPLTPARLRAPAAPAAAPSKGCLAGSVLSNALTDLEAYVNNGARANA